LSIYTKRSLGWKCYPGQYNMIVIRFEIAGRLSRELAILEATVRLVGGIIDRWRRVDSEVGSELMGLIFSGRRYGNPMLR